MRRNVLVDGAASLPALWRLIVGRENWAEPLDASTNGFLRSFAGPLAALPFLLIANAGLSRAYGGSGSLSAAGIWGAVFATLLGAIAFPVAIGLVVRWLGGGAGFGALVVTLNWMTFWLNLLLAVVAMAFRFGLPVAGVQIAGFVLFGLSIYASWRAGRETLTGEIGLSLIVVLLYHGVTLAAAYGGAELGRLVA